jgi:hypothetical protein
MGEGLIIRGLQAADIELMAEAFGCLGWNKPAAQYWRYLSEEEEGRRAVLVAFLDGRFAGYVTVVWQSDYPPFARQGVARRSGVAGLGVGLDPDYGAAQQMYVRRGYVPDGQGLMYAGRRVRHGEPVTVDDSLVLYLIKELEVSHETT